MGNDKAVVELLFILSLLSLSLTFFPGLIRDSVNEVGYFKGSRAAESFNILGIPEGNSVRLYTIYGSAGDIDIADIPNKTPITEAIHDLHRSKARFTIYIDVKTRNMYIYSQCVVPKHIFRMKKVPSGNLSPIETIKALDSSYLPCGSMDLKLVQTLVYLGLKGCLEDKLLILYERMLVLINEKKQMLFFDLDLGKMFEMMFRETDSRQKSERKDCLNRLLFVLKTESNILFLYDPRNEQRGFGKKMARNTLAGGLIKLFPSSRDIKIKNRVDRDSYMELAGIISDKERREGMNVLEKLLIDFVRPDDSSLFS
ncbi:hypothetical protein M970_111530 [Encephalitozoon cuniculi EcunIII-L]|uniref:Uncharacterized protein n=1 Tax=Encephalitozoon cuniculi TaxID=6035 RepID=M1K2C2_ENCCN|nr:hypothetical protein ECU11_1530 [Encephalitozoon cuniculi]KMV65111.1 hypothetical protein M970_111530 [Encephalitozoon cuniculi EcunIII-L]UYI26360.1 hypothetical protein J0A71_01g01800 [Encephalitozoon cuniculi]